MSEQRRKALAVITSGGDAAGMNPAVRSAVRTALDLGVEVYAVYDGYEGLVEGGERIKKMSWDSVGGIIHQGGTVIGTARCDAFRTREGRLQAAQHLLERGIGYLVVIGGDGSLTGANQFRTDWPDLVRELADSGRVPRELAEAHPQLLLVGLVGSIDNDMFGTDMTIGADTALHRIAEAIDAITSTAASHQRTFVVEVMGRHCGYLALMSAISTGAGWVLIPESPPEVDEWEERMCAVLKAARDAGRRHNIVVVAEGARDRNGQPISAAHVKKVLEERLEEDVRITILGHVQRGGAPSAFDRYQSTILAHAAVQDVLAAGPDSEPQIIGIRENRVTRSPLMYCVEQTRSIADVIAARDYEKAMEMRGGSFREAFLTHRTLVSLLPQATAPDKRRLRIAVVHAAAPAPGMNAAVRAAVRLGTSQGHTMLGIRNGFGGLIEGDIRELSWTSVGGWSSRGGAELGTGRLVPSGKDFYAIARRIEELGIQGLLMIGGWTGYDACYRLFRERDNFPAFNIPVVCLPASINNNLPGSELSIGSDTAINSILLAVDRIKQSAVASRRCFVVEVMGRYCGYLALMSGLATGAERIYLHEEGVTLADLQKDLEHLVEGFRHGKRLGLMIRNEMANPFYTTPFMHALFEEEGGDLFDVRQAILGHLQQGGDPSPFDRIQATRLAARCVSYLTEQAEKDPPGGAFIGLQSGRVMLTSLDELPRLSDGKHQRPKEQWWLALRPIARILAQSGPGSGAAS